jgi:hypothetical protein
MAYANMATTEIWRSRADGSDRRRLMTPAMHVWFPQLSADGRRIAFTGQESDKATVSYVMDSNGGPPADVGHARRLRPLRPRNPLTDIDAGAIVVGSRYMCQPSLRPSRRAAAIRRSSNAMKVVSS